MSEEKNTGGSAFPSHGLMGEVACEGMTLRDYFAAKTMMGLVASGYIPPKEAARRAFKLADDMLDARK